MGYFRTWIQRLFPLPKKLSSLDAEALRQDFKQRYHSFIRLINANNRALETMAEMEQALHGEHPFGIIFVRNRCAAVSMDVLRMIKSLQLLAPRKYGELSNRFKKIQQNLDQLITPARQVTDDRLVIPLGSIDKNMADLVGAKMANLGELKNRIKLIVPDGFAITAAAYQRFMEHNDLELKIKACFQSADPGDIKNLNTVSTKVQRLITAAQVPDDIAQTIMNRWRQTEGDAGHPITAAMRSSAIGEDEAGSSFAGLHHSELNISAGHVLESYKAIIASKYSLPSINYRKRKGIRDEGIAMGVGCLVMIDAIAGGVMYSGNPSNLLDDSIFINAAWGLPKAVVDGRVDSDFFVVSRSRQLEIAHQDIRDKDRKFVCYPSEGVCRLDTGDDERNKPSLDCQEVKRLAELAIRIEASYGVRQDIEWAIDHNGSIFILQCRPLQQKEFASAMIPELPPGKGTLEAIGSGGMTASPGATAAPVFLVHQDADILSFPQGAVLVARQALPRWASLLNRAAGMITEKGSVAGHLANVAREFGIPALFGVSGIQEKLKNGDVVTLDASGRTIYRGKIESFAALPGKKENLMEGSPVYETMRQAGNFILPLHLLDPDSPDFAPDNCQSLHDIMRFIHEKAVREMFNFGKEHDFAERSSKQLHFHVPMQWWLLNLDDGFTKEVAGKYVHLENIASATMLAYWEGFAAIPWDGPPSMDGKGLMSVFFQSTTNPALVLGRRSRYAERNYFMISRDYCNLNSRLGYHFMTMEALVSERTGENFTHFQFKGGAADSQRRAGRVRFIGEILEAYGFSVSLREDILKARIEDEGMDYMLKRIKILGYLSLHTRQLDMIMSDSAKVKYYRKKFKKDIDTILLEHDD